jgi:imidazolonepropionase-like amidohydrolase
VTFNPTLKLRSSILSAVAGVALACSAVSAQVAVLAENLYTMASRDPNNPGGLIKNGVVVITDGKVVEVGPKDRVNIPPGHRLLNAHTATPGLIDARATAGLTGILNTPHDSDQLEKSAPIQPELRAIDAYNPQERLVEFLRSFGITTIHTGHAPGELITGQTIVVKTAGLTVDEAVLSPVAAVAATLGPEAVRAGGSPGTRGKQVAMLRSELTRAREYLTKRDKFEADLASFEKQFAAGTVAADKKPECPGRDLRLEMLADVLAGKVPLMVYGQRAQDIASTLRLAEEFKFKLWLEGAAEAHLLTDQIKAAGVPVILHPSMQRSAGENENQSFETAATLVKAGIPVSMQSSYEGYVPKVRVVLFEAAITAAHGLSFTQALATITTEPAKLLGLSDRIGSLEVGKDGDVALYTGDPFEYTTHCSGVVINGKVVSETLR